MLRLAARDCSRACVYAEFCLSTDGAGRSARALERICAQGREGRVAVCALRAAAEWQEPLGGGAPPGAVAKLCRTNRASCR